MPAPDAAAIITPDRTVDRRTLSELVASIESGLAETLPTGTPLGLWIEDSIDFAASAMAALATGAEGFIVHPGAAPARARELCAIEGGTSVLCDTERAARLDGVAQRPCGPGLVLVDLGPDAAPGGVRVGSGHGALHFYTSGTDGTPKGVIRSRESLALEEQTVGPHLGEGPGTRVLCAVPPTHGYGYTAGLMAPLRYGGTSILARPKMAASLSKLLAQHAPDIVVGVPSQYAAWTALRRPHTGPTPRIWLCGGAPLPAAVRARFAAAWGGVISEQYGITECGAVSVDIEGAHTLGRPYPGVTITIEGAEKDGDVGEVIVDAPYGPRGYIGDPAGSDPTRFTAAGFRSGDSGWFDADGRLHLVGRRAHQLNVHGQKVDPAEVERALWSVDGVSDVAVIGMDRTHGDQWIAAFVAGADGVPDEVLHEATSGLESYKRPQRLIRIAALPKNATGKTDFDALRALARTSEGA